MAIDPGVLRECVKAWREAEFTIEQSVEAAILKYLELVPQPGLITAEMVAGGLAVAGWSGDALTRAERKDVAAKLNALSNRQPAPAVQQPAVPDCVREAVRLIDNGDTAPHRVAKIVAWIKTLGDAKTVPAVVVPEDVREWADHWSALMGFRDERNRVAQWIKTLIPTPPKPEPGQRAYEAYCEAFSPGVGKWQYLATDDKQSWAAVEAALKGDADA